MKRYAPRFVAGIVCLAALWGTSPAMSWELHGRHSIRLHPRAGNAVTVGTVEFRPDGERIVFSLTLDHAPFKDYFLSMREFKCLEGEGEIHCHVPYPYRNPGTVTTKDLAWLEHSLLFLFKSPRDYGAKLWNGIYYKMQITAQGIVGLPQAIDLNHIGAPPSDQNLPPYGIEDRTEILPGIRWYDRLTIE